MAVDWQKLAARVDRVVIRTFDHGAGNPDRQVLYQPRSGGANDGEPFRLPAIFDAGYQEVRSGDAQVSGIEPVLEVHYGDFPVDRRPREGDQITVPTGEVAGIYKILDVQPNDDQTGARLPLKRVGNVAGGASLQ